MFFSTKNPPVKSLKQQLQDTIPSMVGGLVTVNSLVVEYQKVLLKRNITCWCVSLIAKLI